MTRSALMPMLLALCTGLGHAASTEIGEVSADVALSPTSTSNSISLRFRFVYSAREDLTISSRSVITHDDSLAVSVMAAEYPHSFEPDGIACPAPREVTAISEGPGSWRQIGRNYQYVADIDLSERFNNLDSILHRCDLVVFWSYKPNLGEKLRTNRLSGAIVVPAHGPARLPPIVVEKITTK